MAVISPLRNIPGFLSRGAGSLLSFSASFFVERERHSSLARRIRRIRAWKLKFQFGGS